MEYSIPQGPPADVQTNEVEAHDSDFFELCHDALVHIFKFDDFVIADELITNSATWGLVFRANIFDRTSNEFECVHKAIAWNADGIPNLILKMASR